MLGATSAVAIAFARQACEQGQPTFILAGRNEARLNEIRADLVARGARDTSSIVVGDLGDPAAMQARVLPRECAGSEDGCKRSARALPAFAVEGDSASKAARSVRGGVPHALLGDAKDE